MTNMLSSYSAALATPDRNSRAAATMLTSAGRTSAQPRVLRPQSNSPKSDPRTAFSSP